MSYLRVLLGIDLAHPPGKIFEFAAISVVFAALGRLVRGVTTVGAATGAVICFVLLWAGGLAGLTALLMVFLLTWATTRVGYSRKQHLGTAEGHSGRNALQVLANLGVSAGCAVLYAHFPNRGLIGAMAAALAEPAADTVSSEIGQAVGGAPRLITTWRTVAEGTNGAITLMGTLVGAFAAIVVALVFFAFGKLGRASFVVVALSGIAGMVADSLLGATIEGRGRMGNNAVNFMSTIIAAILAFFIAQ